MGSALVYTQRETLRENFRGRWGHDGRKSDRTNREASEKDLGSDMREASGEDLWELLREDLE